MNKLLKRLLIAMLIVCSALAFACFAACGETTPDVPDNPPQQEQPKNDDNDNNNNNDNDNNNNNDNDNDNNGGSAENTIDVKLSEDGKTVIGLNKSDVTDLVILSEYNGVTVTAIKGSAFNNCKTLKSVTIPESITSIGIKAFNGCTALTSVTIPNSVTSMEMSAFYGCSALTSATIGNGLTNIPVSAFEGCSALTTVTIGSNVNAIGSQAFRNCTSLTNITMPDGVTEIYGNAFNGCRKLKTVKIGSGLTKIESAAFENCNSITDIYYAGTVDAWAGSIDGLYNLMRCNTNTKKLYINEQELTEANITTATKISYAAFQLCTLTSATIGDSVTSIGRQAFYRCTSLTTVTIGSGVKIIYLAAFGDCSNLTSATFSVTNGWYKALGEKDNSGDSVDFTNPARNATSYLTGTYQNYYLKRK